MRTDVLRQSTHRIAIGVVAVVCGLLPHVATAEPPGAQLPAVQSADWPATDPDGKLQRELLANAIAAFDKADPRSVEQLEQLERWGLYPDYVKRAALSFSIHPLPRRNTRKRSRQ